MRPGLVALLLLAGLGAVAPASAETRAVIAAPDRVSPGDLVILDGSGSTDAAAFHWTAVGHDKTCLPVEGNRKLVFATGQPGLYRFALVVAGVQPGPAGEAPQLAVDVAVVAVRVGEPEPPPPPPIPPPPPVPPGPKTTLIFYETSAQTQQEGALLNAIRVQAGQRRILIVDKDVQEEKLAKWAGLAGRVGRWPALVIATAEGRIAHQGPLPATAAEALALIDQYGG